MAAVVSPGNHLRCRGISWKGRPAYELRNGVVRLVSLTGGGHIAEFSFCPSSGQPTTSPLWVPPWKTIDPFRYREGLHASTYGSIAEGKLLSGIVGHNLCLDYFGSPSPEEARQGLSQHGEAGTSRWHRATGHVSPGQGSNQVSLRLKTRLPVAELDLTRELRLCRNESVVYFKETVVNRRKCDHFFHWTQHVTLGPPFLSERGCLIALPGTRGRTFPHGYDEDKALLASGADFRWPLAPLFAGGQIDLTRPLPQRGAGFVAGVLLDIRREMGFITAVNTQMGLMVGYCFRRADFPWVAVWDENLAIEAPPWHRRTRARGLEFGSTPLPVSRREAFSLGPLFGTPTLTCLPARSYKTVRYVAFLAAVPQEFTQVRDVKLAGEEIIVTGYNTKAEIRLSASRLAAIGAP